MAEARRDIAVPFILIVALVQRSQANDPKNLSSSSCAANQYGTYRVALQFCDGNQWRVVQPGEPTIAPGTSCLDIKRRGLSRGDGQYMIDPLGNSKLFQAYCDMTSFGGGWTMCYTTDSHVDIKTELVTTPLLGYRADCNNIPFKEVLFVDVSSKQQAYFTKDDDSAVTFSGNYDKDGDAYGEWTAHGVASTKYKYQMLICDTSFYKGLHFSVFTGCWKECDHWCTDPGTQPYFRTAAVSSGAYSGVAFNEDGHRSLPKRLISAGIR